MRQRGVYLADGMQVENEELKHILWTSVLFYRSPDVETTACVLLSTKAIYFILDDTASSLTNQSSEQKLALHLQWQFYYNLIFKYIQFYCSSDKFSLIIFCSSNLFSSFVLFCSVLFSLINFFSVMQMHFILFCATSFFLFQSVFRYSCSDILV